MLKRGLSLLVVLLLAVSMLAGCGGAAKHSATESAKPQAAEMYGDAKADYSVKETPKSEEPAAAEKKAETENSADMDTTAVQATAFTGNGASGQSLSNAILAQRKIIRNANISVEVDDFEKAYGQIKSLISAFGFIQESNIRKEKVYQDGKEKLITRGVIIVRVDKDRFENVLSDIKGLGLLLDESIKSDDVTDKFFDVESRLRLLKFEQSRLEQYLEKINDPDTIFKTESRLTDIRHEIERLTGTLKKWSDLVELSTITINISEKGFGSGVPAAQNKTYWGRLTGGFLGSIKGVAVFFGEFLIVAVQALPVLAILGLLVFACIAAYRKISAKNLNNAIKKNKDTDSNS